MMVPTGFNEAAGNSPAETCRVARAQCAASTNRFNEAAGIHRRKTSSARPDRHARSRGFNEAAGIHRRKRMTEFEEELAGDMGFNEWPPEFTGRKQDRQTGAVLRAREALQ